jgi:FAD synthetase
MGKRVVCAGTFDHFHPGHVHFLKEARALGEELIVIVARDETVMRIKGFLPSHNEETRKGNVEESGIPDRVILGNPNTNIFLILTELQPDIMALGYDQRVSEDEISRIFPRCEVIRLKPFQPDRYKSSFYREKIS